MAYVYWAYGQKGMYVGSEFLYYTKVMLSLFAIVGSSVWYQLSARIQGGNELWHVLIS